MCVVVFKRLNDNNKFDEFIKLPNNTKINCNLIMVDTRSRTCIHMRLKIN